MSENVTQLLCRLVHQNCSTSDVLERLPASTDRTDDVAKSLRTDLEVPTHLRSNSCLVAKVFNQVIDYQRKKNHDKPAGYFDNRDQLLAKRLFCEITKDSLQRWAITSNGVDDRVSKSDVQPHLDLIEHLMYYRDRFAGKSKGGSPTFLDLLLGLDDMLRQLLQHCDKWDTSYCKALDDIYDLTGSFCDNALCVTLLGVTNNHNELIQNLRGEPLSVTLLSRMRSNSAPIFWATDLGQLISAALVRGDPEDFKPLSSVWTDSYGTVRRSDFNSFDEAVATFEEATRSGQCAVLTGSEGEHRNNRQRLTARVLHEHAGVWQRMEDVAIRHILLQHAASSTAKAFEELADNATGSQLALTGGVNPEITPVCNREESFPSPESFGTSNSDSSRDVGKAFAEQIEEVRKRWMGSMSQSGVAEAFRHGSRSYSSSASGLDTPSEDSRTNLPTLILKFSVTLSDLLFARRHVMGEVRALSHGGSSEMTLLAIRALRRGMKFTKLLLASMDRFLDCASSVHAGFDLEWRKMLRGRAQINDQVTEMQRCYFESFKNCVDLRKKIMAQWQQLDLLIGESQLEEDLQGMMQSRSQAYRRLASPQVTTLALSKDGTSPMQSIQSGGQIGRAPVLEVD